MEFLETLKETRKTYEEMVEFCTCTNDLILNNVIVDELERNGFYFDAYCGSRFYYTDENGDKIDEDIFQTYIISGDAAKRFAEYTDEIVGYCEALNLYVLYVTHYETSWDYVKSNWKQEE